MYIRLSSFRLDLWSGSVVGISPARGTDAGKASPYRKTRLGASLKCLPQTAGPLSPSAVNTHVMEVNTHVKEVNTHVKEVNTHVMEVNTHVLEVNTHVGSPRTHHVELFTSFKIISDKQQPHAYMHKIT
jgi:hypothetical protein